jgi:hypothetical protein
MWFGDAFYQCFLAQLMKDRRSFIITQNPIQSTFLSL